MSSRRIGLTAACVAALVLAGNVAQAIEFGNYTSSSFSFSATDTCRTTDNPNSIAAVDAGAVYWRGSVSDHTYAHFDLSSLAGLTISGSVNLNFNINTGNGGQINNGQVATANSAYTATVNTTAPAYTLIPGSAGPNGNYANGATATWTIPQVAFQSLVDNPSTFYGLMVLAASGSNAHFNGLPTLTGTTASGGEVTVTGETDWSAAAWDDLTMTLTVSGSGDVIGGDVAILGSATTLSVIGSATMGAGDFGGSIANQGTLSMGSSASQTLSGIISGSGSLLKTGDGTLTLSNANTFTGTTKVADGVLALTNNQAIQNSVLDTSGSGVIALGSPTALKLAGLSDGAGARSLADVFAGSYANLSSVDLAPAGGTSNSYSGDIAEGASGMTLTIAGAGTQTLSGNSSTFTGGVTLTSGTLKLGGTAALGTGTLTINGGKLDSAVAGLVNANNNPQVWNTDITFVGSNSLDLGTGAVTMNADRTVTVAASTLAVGGINAPSRTLTKAGAGTLTLNGATTLGNLYVGYSSNPSNINYGTLAVGSGGTLSVGSGSSNNVFIGVGSGTANNGTLTGKLDVSAAASFTANVNYFKVGGTIGGNGYLYLGADNTITAATEFGVGHGGWGWPDGYGTATTAAGGTTTIHTPAMYVGHNVPNGTTAGAGTFTLGSGATLNVDGLSGGRTALSVGVLGAWNGAWSAYTNSLDLSGAGTGVANLKLKSLLIGNMRGGGNPVTGQVILSSSESNHLDISGSSITYVDSSGSIPAVVAIGANDGGGAATGTLTIGNLDSTSSIVSESNGTAILLAYKGSTGSATGTLNLGGGTLTIATTGSAIVGGGGSSYLTLGNASGIGSGMTLKAVGANANWISGLTSAKIRTTGVTFDTNGYDIGIPQALLADTTDTGGGLTKAGLGTLTLSGANTFTGSTVVSGGKLIVTPASALLSSGASIGAAELQYDSPTALASVTFTGTGGTLSGIGTVTSPVTVPAGNTITAGSPSGTLTLGGLSLETGTTVRVASGGASQVQVNGDYTDSLGTHTLVTGLATPDTPYPFITWTGNTNLASGTQSNWTIVEGDTGTKKWTSSESGSWTTPSAWDGLGGTVTATITESTKNLSYTMSYVVSGSKAPTAGNDVVIDPTTSAITVTGPDTAAAVSSLQIGGVNNQNPVLALGTGNLTVTGAVTVSNGTLNASAAGLIAPTLNVNGADAVVTLGHASTSLTTANVTAGSLAVDAGTVATANLSGTGTLAGTQAVPQVNVTGGTPTFTGKATAMTVTDGTLAFNSTQANGTLTLPTGSTGTVVAGPGAQVATADLTAGAGTVTASNPLAISSALKLVSGSANLTFTAGTTPFKAGGANLVSNVDTLVLQGGTTKIDWKSGGYAAGLTGMYYNLLQRQEPSTTIWDNRNASTPSLSAIDLGGGTNQRTDAYINWDSASSHGTGLANWPKSENLFIRWEGKIYVANDTNVKFGLNSDDGSQVWIDGVSRSSYEGYHGASGPSWGSNFTLTAGYHDFVGMFYEWDGGEAVNLYWDSGSGSQIVPASAFFHGAQVEYALDLPTLNVSVEADSELNLSYAGAATLGDLNLSAGALSFQTATGVSVNKITATGTSSIAAGVPITLRGGEVNVGPSAVLTLNPATTVTSMFTKTGAGTLALGGALSTSLTTVADGSMELAAPGVLPATSVLTLGSGTTSGRFALKGNSQTLLWLETSGTGADNQLVNDSSTPATLTIQQGDSEDDEYSGSLGGTTADENNFALLKTGSGKLILSGANSYANGTTVEGGTLVIASAGALPAGKSLSIGSGGTLILGGGMAMGTSAQSAEPVPEPGTLALLAIAGLAGAMVWKRRK